MNTPGRFMFCCIIAAVVLAARHVPSAHADAAIIALSVAIGLMALTAMVLSLLHTMHTRHLSKRFFFNAVYRMTPHGCRVQFRSVSGAVGVLDLSHEEFLCLYAILSNGAQTMPGVKVIFERGDA